MPSDHDSTQRAFGRLSDRITERDQHHAQQLDEIRDALSGIISELRTGKGERQKIIDDLEELKGRVEAVEDTTSNAAQRSAAYAATVAKTAVQGIAPVVTPWGRAFKWFVAICVGFVAIVAAVSRLPIALRVLSDLGNWIIKQGGTPL